MYYYYSDDPSVVNLENLENFNSLDIHINSVMYLVLREEYVSITYVVSCWLEIRHWNDNNNRS